MSKDDLENKVEEEKRSLERRIRETIRILSCTHPNDKEQLKRYQEVLIDYSKEWRDKYETDYKYSK